MKIILTAVNAKYIHSNLAVYTLQSSAEKAGVFPEIREFTINQSKDSMLRSLFLARADVVCVSCYIWNISIVEDLITEYHKISPKTKIWLGGPEVSYHAEEMLEQYPFLAGIMKGEGEVTFREIAVYYQNQENGMEGKTLEEIHGITYRDADGAVKSNPWRPVMDLSEVDFPYANLKKFENRIIYYESSRGCPFSCSYCLSSIDKRLRFRNLDLVKKELAFFLEQKVPQVKFVDRTFNCKKDHAMAIWKFIAEHDNGVTNFHFEIAADLITEEELELLNTLRPGLVQLEIGVQSTNPQTIEAIHRKMDFGKVTEIVNRIAKGRNIHQHLDLIAGLPYEDYASFRRSFADVYALQPQQLQLGFLKVLRGSFMYEHTKEYDCHYQEREPYEVLYTKWLPYDDVLKLKDVEEMVEVYYNSGQFVHTLPMIERLYENPFDFFQELGDFYRAKGYSEAAHNRIQRYEILLEFLRDEKQQDEAFFRQMMVLDLYARENMKTRPHFAKDPSEWKNESRDFYQKEAETRTLLPSYTTYDWKQLQRMTHVEVFDYDVLGNGEKARTVLLFDYQKRDPLTGNAEMIDCSELFYA
ncbi:B12-binding domain-containing radical SAM protein [Fusicatenibacter saccharivorans]|uniref:B12-binding domain-containing radical SAM protein n=1 Tax=Fusicatenibacter saccharivorans TaxID=1150298 RepID=UPI00156FC130|nr:B12-binding domain-containing radical SAM protein [Fusicatenibacter saccharivorans]MCB5525429.1 B12-binding domain-containing radical SAM protein [Fusicatenibacter saccharivorans]MCB5670704.1 B12-binding domain-containing radical SAM protein [Fusicatenibacter saccharivorans]MCB5690038.1 B12-binding domain-containing radical SAM protein [Fusicatenibacter saccharivorans]MCB5693707.1 B12-binding domain-containing radical SAM protein [Fusicatenibacter saccharivorans]MCC2729310.1 B12-binding dom